MSEIKKLNSLHGCRLRSPLGSVIDKLGPPDNSDLSPPDPTPLFAHHEWNHTSPPMAVLTWIVDSKEYVWGVRIVGPGPIDMGLGFGVGSARRVVAAGLTETVASEPDSVWQWLDDGSLTIRFHNDVVREIELLAPIEAEQAGSSAEPA